jgi:hypothetical protein
MFLKLCLVKRQALTANHGYCQVRDVRDPAARQKSASWCGRKLI